MFVSPLPKNFYAETLTPNVLVFEGGTFGIWSGFRFRRGHEGGALAMGLVPL